MDLDLFLRTFSQALQAFTPIALSLTWFERTGDTRTASAIRRGLILALPATVAGSWLFRRSTHQAFDEAVLATIAIAATLIVARSVWHTTPAESKHLSLSAVTTVAALIVVRQTMEIGALLETAAIDLRVFVPTMTILGALKAGICAALVLRYLVRRLPDREMAGATRAFVVVFFVQCAIYAFHEFAEARLLPFSEALHAASEPYGPDGIYGVHLSDLLLVAPLAAAAFISVRTRERLAGHPRFAWRQRAAVPWVGTALLALIALQGAGSSARVGDSTANDAAIAAIARRPHLLFRDLTRTARPGTVPHAGMLSLTPLDAPESRRASTELPCERVSFAAGHGLCLHTVPGIFPRYTAAILDGALRPTASIALDGRPSRTRTSADGRVGAITVFVFGDNYAAPFSTRTTIVDMSSGDVIGELEQFSTWRDGERFKAADFNFWGVTFAADANVFYATLRTAGSTYLVRGELALRRMTVLRENVECPSLSPDGRLIAFKKRVGRGSDEWRLTVLDLTTMTERTIDAEARHVDDQIEWLDSARVLYAVPGGTTSIADVWVAPIDGSAPARIFLPEAESPIVVR